MPCDGRLPRRSIRRRLPDVPLRLLLLAALVPGVGLCATLAGGAVVLGTWWALARTGAAALVAFHVAAAVAALASDALGFGEVELLGALGPVLGWTRRECCWPVCSWGLPVGASVSMVLLATRRAGWRTAIPFGPRC